MPLIAFVTAYDEYAVRAFEVNAVDYLLKPVEKARLRETLNRAQERIEHAEIVAEQASHVGRRDRRLRGAGGGRRIWSAFRCGIAKRWSSCRCTRSRRSSRRASCSTSRPFNDERHTITYRLKDLERRLDPARFIRLGRGTLANVDLITKVSVMPGGTHVAILSNGQKLQVSRLQSRILRDRFLKL